MESKYELDQGKSQLGICNRLLLLMCVMNEKGYNEKDESEGVKSNEMMKEMVHLVEYWIQ